MGVPSSRLHEAKLLRLSPPVQRLHRRVRRADDAVRYLAGADGAEIAAAEGMIISARAFHRRIAADAESVLAAGSNTVSGYAIDRQGFARLPTPVRAYLELALGDRSTAPRNVT